MNPKNEKKNIASFGVDRRTRQDILDDIEKKSKSYTPEWVFSKDDPDIGSVIAQIFADQSERTIGVINRVYERYRLAFVNLLDITRDSVTPAHSIVTMNVISSTIPGVDLAAGTRLLVAEAPVDENGVTDTVPVFETDKSFHVTGASITELFMTDEKTGDVIPLKGDFKEQELILEDPAEDFSADITEEPLFPPEPSMVESFEPFTLFGKKKGIGKNAIILYHDSAFDTEGAEIRLYVKGNDSFLQELSDSERYLLSYKGEEGIKSFDSVKLSENKEYISLLAKEPFTPVSVEGTEYGALIIEAAQPVTEEVSVSTIGISSEGEPILPIAVSDGNSDLDPDNFLPFTDTLSLYADCNISCDRYFRMTGARCTVEFSVTFLENIFDLTVQQVESALKIIKRKPRAEITPAYADVFIQEIAVEYFNGIGYRKLDIDTELSTSLEKATAGKLRFSFIIPSDWEPVDSTGVEGRAIRFRILKADNCYMRPAVHHYPRFTDMRISYSYDGQSVAPKKITRISGTKKDDITKDMNNNENVPVFKRSEYYGDCLYIGLSKCPETGPVSLFVDLEDRMSHLPIPITFEYSSQRGFRQLKVMDYTDSLSRAGIIMFDPPSDFCAVKLEEKSRHWLRISRDMKKDALNGRTDVFLPVIRNMKMNGMTVTNLEENAEDDFYIDEVKPDMTFTVNYEGLVRIELWVNEFKHITKEDMEKLEEDDGTRVRIERDALGNITAFYVLWKECRDFDTAEDRRVYRLDRVNKLLMFGNGLSQDIPRVTDDIAFRVKTYTSMGDIGNVPAHSITETDGPAMYLDEIDNPVRGFGGEKVESMERALLRGAGMISSRRKLISKEDYLVMIRAFSESIDKCACVTGKCIDGNGTADDISFVFLMKDFAEGSLSFHMVSERIRRFMEKRCELTIDPMNLHFVEPIYVDIAVNVWMKVNSLEDSFALQNRIKEGLDQYLNPVSSGGNTGNETRGWNIGVLPQKSQIMMKLVALKGSAKISKMTVTASFKDKEGFHEIDLTELSTSPYFVIKPGAHQIYIDYE